MGTRPRRKQRRQLERWQVLLASAVAAVASIIVALISVGSGGSPGETATRVLPTDSSSAAPSAHIAITGLLEQAHPPPPGRLYVWTGTVRGLPADASIYVIDKRPGGGWLVSPAAVIARNGSWTVWWFFAAPPASARWIAVVVITVPAPSGISLGNRGPSYVGVIGIAKYHPLLRPTPAPSG